MKRSIIIFMWASAIAAILASHVGWFQGETREIGEDIDGISGATQTVSSIGRAIKRSLQIIESKVLTGRKSLGLFEPGLTGLRRLNVWFLLVLAFSALLSYLARVRWLRTLILACSLIYLGILSSTFFSIYHITSLLKWELPPFRYNVLWWVLIMIVFILSLGFGRVWCGYLCPFGALQEFIYRFTPFKAKPLRFTSNGVDKGLKFIKYIFLWIIVVLFFSMGKVNLSNYEPYTTLFSMRGSIFGWVLVVVCLGSSVFVSRFWCRYFCLAGACLAIVSRVSLVRLKLTGDCGGCNRCVEGCGMGAFERSKGIDHSECIGCNRCRNLCKDKFVKILSVLLIAIMGLVPLINSVSHAETLHNPGLENVGEKGTGVIRQPVVAGGFYPAKRQALEAMIDKFLMEAKPPSIEGELIALIVPHAGYIYSGAVAAFGYKHLMDKKFDIVVVVGPSHHLYFAGSSIYNVGDYLTPLGRVRVDRELCNRIIAADERITYNRLAHLEEHSLEVELPFLQRVLGDFSLIPIVMGDRSRESCVALARVLADQLKGKNAIILASSDMSHYHEYEVARLIDARTLRLIEKFSPLELLNEIASGDAQLCGGGPVVATMMAAQRLGADRVKVLKYANSGDTAGDRSRVVGYCALAFFKGRRSKESVNEAGLSEEARKELLGIARKTIETYLAQGKIPEFDVANEELNSHAGAFVTLHKFGQLRGCIGHFQADRPLYKVVAEMAIAAATKDLRFYPLTEQELPSIKFEISVLSPLKKIEDIDEIELGKHGIYITKGYRSGCFLPQVARETGWSKIEFLEHCSQDKAGLGTDGWKEADIYTFTAEVFGEE